MSGPQFIHLETYARDVSKQSKDKTNIRGVMGEAMREAGYTSHLQAPQAPSFIFGNQEEFKAIEAEINGKAQTEKDPLGRKIRSDANLLMAGVASYPKPFIAQKTADEQQNYELWLELTKTFLVKEFGDNLRCIIEHKDEEYPHLHFYVVDKAKVSNTMLLHPGHKAKAAYPNKKDKLGKEDAYRNAMKDWQNKFHMEVGENTGLTRLGPKVQRLTRTEWKAQKQQASAFARIKQNIDDTWDNLQSQLNDFEKEKATFDKKVKNSIREAVSSIKTKYEEGMNLIDSTLKGLGKQKDWLALKYPDQAEKIQEKSFTEKQAENMVKAYEEAKEESKSKKAAAGNAFRPPFAKKPWEMKHEKNK